MEKGFNKIRSAIFLEGRVNRVDVARIADNKRCQTITLTRVNCEKIDFLLHLPGLKDVRFYGCAIDDYSALTELKKVKALFFNGLRTTNPNLTFLSDMRALETLKIGYALHLTSFPDLSACQNLKEVMIFNCMKLKDISTLASIPNLENLDIVETPHNPKDLEFIMPKESLNSVSAEFGSKKLNKEFKDMLEAHGLKSE